MKEIFEEIDRAGCVDDDDVAYHPKDHAFTLEEFRAFTDGIWNEAGGWEFADCFEVKNAYFETYAVPFENDGKKYILNIMYGQGSATTAMTEEEYGNYQDRLTVLQQKYFKEELSEEEEAYAEHTQIFNPDKL